MKRLSFLLIISGVALIMLNGCAVPEKKDDGFKYPRKPMDNPERKSGPAMLFYEAAENDADPEDQVIVIPPDQVRK